MAQKRLTYFDTAKGIGIFLVILGHLQGDWFFSLSPYILPLCTFIFSFHMPLFFVISGMLIRYKNDEAADMKTLCRRRLRSLMIPYLWFSLLYLSVVVYALIRGNIKAETLYLQLWYTLSLHGMNVLWFLPALFGAEMLFLLIRKKTSGKITACIILVATAAVTVCNMLLGRVAFTPGIGERLHDLCLTLMRPVFGCAFIAIGYFVYGFFRERDRYFHPEGLLGILLIGINVFVHRFNGAVDFRSLVLNNPGLYFLSALSGSFGLILLCKNLPPLKPVTFFGCNSLIVMVVHNNETILYLAQNLAMLVNRYVTRARGYISYLVVVLVLVLYSTLMVFLIKRFFGFLIGRPSPFDRLFTRHKAEENS